MKIRYAVMLLLAGCLAAGCSGRKPAEGWIVYQKETLFPVYDAGSAAELNEKMKDATLKVHYARYSTDFGPADIRVVESKDLAPCVYLGDVPLIYADADCAKGYGLPQSELARRWARTLKDKIFKEKPTEPFPQKINLVSSTGREDPFAFASRNSLPLFIHIYADWCGACVKMEPGIAAAERELENKAVFVMLNVDDPDSQPLIDKYSFDNAIPQNIFATPDGEPVKRVLGYMSDSEIVSAVDSVR